MIKVLLIDTGIVDEYKDRRIVGGCSIVSDDGKYIINEQYTDYIGHGTATADIILKYSKNINIYILRIYEADLYIKEEKLVYALEYARENLDYDMIQISSGLLTYSSKMHEIIKDIVKKDKKIIISAFDNEGGMSYPAAFPEVIGIDINHSYKKKDEYDIVEDDIVDVRGSGFYFRVPWINNAKNIVNGTSFLTSYFTAWIGENCEERLEKQYIISKLKENAIETFSAFDEKNYISSSDFVKQIKKAITFPFNKEMYCLAAFEDKLDFQITGYYDVKHKFIVGKKINEVLKYTQNEAVIQNVDSIDWNANFDTVIIGHLSEISEVTKKDYLDEMIALCKQYHKRAYIFDDLGLRYNNYENSNYFFSPIIVNKNLYNHFGKLRTCNVPVLAVMGTSSRQGKYTIQLSIFNEFKRRGIKVDGIATEPTGALFGFSEMFACGYGSNNYLSSNEMIKMLNEKVHKLETQNNELIITGGQSGTIAYDLRNESLIPYEQYSFLIGTNPDGVILCVNEMDDYVYVKKTINFIESATNAKVFSIVVSSARTTKDTETDNVIDAIKAEYGDRMTYHNLIDLDASALVDDIMNYYE